MKVAIIAEDRHGFIRPMSQGLKKMLAELDVKADIFERGLAMLEYSKAYQLKSQLGNWVKSTVNLLKPRSYELRQLISSAEVRQFEGAMQGYDLIIVVCPLPRSFIAKQLSGIERLRRHCKAPIALYQNYYLATRGDWADKIRDPKNYGGGYGLERYDWYLAAAMVSDIALTDKPHPCTLLGHDIRSENLHCEDKVGFKVLLDFHQEGHQSFRDMQIQALEECGIAYTRLQGRYSQDEIRALYRSHSALFLSCRESFCLPIVENQLCGSLIFAAQQNWCPSHYIGKSVHDSGVGELGCNFVVYDNDLNKLKDLLLHHQKHYDATKVLAQFEQEYPQLHHGDLAALKTMLDDVASGRINGMSHQKYRDLV